MTSSETIGVIERIVVLLVEIFTLVTAIRYLLAFPIIASPRECNTIVREEKAKEAKKKSKFFF